jgi:protein crumbs
MEKRVTARTKASARAIRPMSEAPRTEAPSGRAVLSETGRAFTSLVALEPDDGWSVGNRPPALPPGLSVGLMAEVIPGRLPTGSGDVVVSGNASGVGDVDGLGDVDGVTVPEIWTVADDVASVARLAALPVTVNLTDFTVDAVVGTVDSAWSCRRAEFACIPPRLHDAVPSSLPQPKLNFGAALDGVACSRTIASVRSPPVVQAVTTHWVAAPRSLVESEADISTQRLTSVLWTACAPPLDVAVAEGEGVVEGGSLAERDGDVEAGSLAERDGDVEREAVADEDGDGLCVGWGELDGVAVGEELADGLALALLVAAGVVAPLVGDSVGVTFGLAAVLLGVEEGLGDGDELGVEDAPDTEDAASDLEGLGEGEELGVEDGLGVDDAASDLGELGDGDELGVEDGLGVDDAAGDLDGLGDGEVVGVADLLGVLSELVFEGELGASVCLTSTPARANVVPGLTLVLALVSDGVADGSLLVAVGVGVGVDECVPVGVAVGVELGGGSGGLTGSHDSLLLTAASSAATA